MPEVNQASSSSSSTAAPPSSTNYLKKYEKPGITLDELEEMKEAFDLFDLQGTGRIAPNDLFQAIQSLGLENKNNVVQQIMKDMERVPKGGIDFHHFVELFSARLGERDTKEDIAKVFRLFDDDQTGFISPYNLARVASEVGEALTAEELKEMILRADTTHTGRVSLDDFYSLMVHRTFP